MFPCRGNSSASAFRDVRADGKPRYRTYLTGWQPNGKAAGEVHLYIQVGNYLHPVPLKQPRVLTNACIGDPRGWSLSVPDDPSLRGTSVTLRLFAVGVPLRLCDIDEAFPIHITL